MNFELEQQPTNEEEMLAQRKNEFDKRVLQLQLENGWSPRKAKRAMYAHSNRQLKKFKKQVAANRGKDRPLIVPTEEELNGED